MSNSIEKAVSHIKPARKVVASFNKANDYLGRAQKMCNENIQQFLKSDLSTDYNADRLAYWRAELAGVRKLQALALIVQG